MQAAGGRGGTLFYDRLSVYLNLDNGAGKIRGVYLQGNRAAVPMFESWLKPLKEFGAMTVSIRDSEGSDHEVFDRAGGDARNELETALRLKPDFEAARRDLKRLK